MLRKRSMPLQRSSSFSSDHVVHKARGSPFFTVPGLSKKSSSDSDSAKSPTSSFDCRLFAILGNSFEKSPRSPGVGVQPKSWDCDRVGLGLVDKILDTSEGKSILIGSQLRIQVPVAKTHLNSVKDEQVPSQDQAQLSRSKSSSEVLLSKLSPNLSGSSPIPIAGIELSEDYTCIISHGPNPKTTHIFGDCILDDELIQSLECKSAKDGDVILPCDDFLSNCFSCKKKLEQGEDVYIYRGDKAFCSGNCRDEEIFCEEEIEKTTTDASADHLDSSLHEDVFMGLGS